MKGGAQRFGHVEFDEALGRLTVAGRRVALDRPCRSIFAVLLSEAGRDVPKDRLLEAGWPGRFVDENSLAKAISRLRRALGEDGKAIETVHGYGYRLAAPVELVEAAQAPPRARLWRRPAAFASGAGLALAALALAAFYPARSTGEPERIVHGEAPDAIGRVLWVDDHPENNVVETRFLEDRKVAVYRVATTHDALTLLPMYQYGAVISDMGRGDRPLAGIDLLREMRARGDDRPFFLYTVHSSDEQRRLIAEAGGQGVIETRDGLYAAILPLFEAAAR